MSNLANKTVAAGLAQGDDSVFSIQSDDNVPVVAQEGKDALRRDVRKGLFAANSTKAETDVGSEPGNVTPTAEHYSRRAYASSELESSLSSYTANTGGFWHALGNAWDSFNKSTFNILPIIGKVALAIGKGLCDSFGITDIVTGIGEIYVGIKEGNWKQALSGLWKLAKGAAVLALTCTGYGQFVGAAFQLLEGNFTGAILSLGVGALALGGSALISKAFNKNTLEVAKSGLDVITKDAASEVAKQVGDNVAKVAPEIMKQAGKNAVNGMVAGVETALEKGLVAKTSEALAGAVQQSAAKSVESATQKGIETIMQKAATSEIVENVVFDKLNFISTSSAKKLAQHLLENGADSGITSDNALKVAKALQKVVGKAGENGAFDEPLKKMFVDKTTQKLEELMISQKGWLCELMQRSFAESLHGGFSQMCTRLEAKGISGVNGLFFNSNGTLLSTMEQSAQKGFSQGFESGFTKGLECIRALVQKGVDDAFKKFRKNSKDLGASAAAQNQDKQKTLQSIPEEKQAKPIMAQAEEELLKKKVQEDALKSKKPKYYANTSEISISAEKKKKAEQLGPSIYKLNIGNKTEAGQQFKLANPADFDIQSELVALKAEPTNLVAAQKDDIA